MAARDANDSGEPVRPAARPHAGFAASRRDAGEHPELAAWATNVGAPVALDLAEAPALPVHGLTVLCWNVAIGAGRVRELLAHYRRGAFLGLEPDPRYPLVLLLQEVFRSDDTISEHCVGRCHGGRLRSRERGDIVDLARAEGLSLRYAPSMRNGLDRSDRGNAVLSTVPIDNAWTLTLPYVRQRRVAVGVSLRGIENLALVSAHLDTGGRVRSDAKRGRFGGGRVAQARAIGRAVSASDGCTVIGADLNSAFGVRDPAVLALVEAGMHPATRCGRWWHTFHGPLPLLLDHVLFRSPDRRISGVEVHRLDEVEGDGSRRVFGSDHHPLLAHVRFAGSPAPASRAANGPTGNGNRAGGRHA